MTGVVFRHSSVNTFNSVPPLQYYYRLVHANLEGAGDVAAGTFACLLIWRAVYMVQALVEA